jgi:hypothetical protein
MVNILVDDRYSSVMFDVLLHRVNRGGEGDVGGTVPHSGIVAKSK